MDNKQIRKFLFKIGISSNLQGYFYILDCVDIIKKEKTYTNVTTLYEIESKKYKKNQSSIKRSISHAITQSFSKTNKLKEIYGYLPDNSTFLHDLVFNFDILNED